MCNFKELTETNFEFNNLDQSFEFNEFFDYVFKLETKKKTVLFFVFKKNMKKKKTIIGHVINYYVSERGYNKCKFLKP
jgi:hypothetical protein